MECKCPKGYPQRRIRGATWSNWERVNLAYGIRGLFEVHTGRCLIEDRLIRVLRH